ncbi:hypothetical protein C8K38_111219 [Rhodococcus sp. OK611]|uniref:hypothetical protein n=1 Tax=unclassified Rhodococcus (in: high G+C Gram-positive bacteria) TaxID=192944 RepID=UPI000BCC8A3B|nr:MULTISPECIES: hypothetical protein [unclassified Rhodococcus (in: high G+C Gram-positive bacteria)]PTR42050.1 hypothetical protein C8K38_111219 [Rhodococcus sp. OK611]SNX91503.1 hypothetical protein SAMN05447004_11038 [Rhodococcus sp. OK270]
MSRYVYRITVDRYPTPGGQPFTDLDDGFWEDQVYAHSNPEAGGFAEWLPNSFGEWLYADEWPGEPEKIGRTIFGGDAPLLKIPVCRRRHWLSASTARGVVAGLREWGCEVRLERCRIDEWEAVQ